VTITEEIKNMSIEVEELRRPPRVVKMLDISEKVEIQ
jgi:hypothetical protein